MRVFVCLTRWSPTSHCAPVISSHRPILQVFLARSHYFLAEEKKWLMKFAWLMTADVAG